MDKASIQSFRDLDSWKTGFKLAVQIYQLTKEFPKEEQFGLISQLRRCAVSIPSNIAEGFHRQGKREKIQFYYVASGSVAELETQLMLAIEIGYIDKTTFKAVMTQAAATHKLIYGLIRSIKNWNQA